MRIILVIVVVGHVLWIAVNLVSVALLILWLIAGGPWFVIVPLITSWSGATLSRGGPECVLTRLENSIRRRLGMPEIRGFIKHYTWRAGGRQPPDGINHAK